MRLSKDEYASSPPTKKTTRQRTEGSISATTHSKVRIIRLRSKVEDFSGTSQQLPDFNPNVSRSIRYVEQQTSQMSLTHLAEDLGLRRADDSISNLRFELNGRLPAPNAQALAKVRRVS